MIATVLGPIEISSITGSCSPHEQLLQKLSPSDSKAAYGNPITLHNLANVRSSDTGRFAASNRLFSLDESVQELRSLVDAGGGLVLECSTSREGRDPSGLVEISRRTGMHIVMAASWKGVRIALDYVRRDGHTMGVSCNTFSCASRYAAAFRRGVLLDTYVALVLPLYDSPAANNDTWSSSIISSNRLF